MNRLVMFAAFSAILLAAAPRAAQARDLSGRWGLGASTAFAPGMTTGVGNNFRFGPPGLSLKYALNEKFSINPGLGIAYTSIAGNESDQAQSLSDYVIGARGLYTVVQEGNANFYVGGGIILNLRSKTDPDTRLPVAVSEGKEVWIPLIFGAELFFSKRSNFSVMAEGGLEIGYLMPSGEGARKVTMVNTVGGVFNIGFHWYFSGSTGDEEGGGAE